MFLAEGGSFQSNFRDREINSDFDFQIDNLGFNTGTLDWELVIQSCERCGDLILQLRETCDDGNQTPGDGCSDLCLIEPDWFCETSVFPNPCSECGDGFQVGGGEMCDDGSLLDGEGCFPDCSGEFDGWYCSGGDDSHPDVCSTLCGDGFKVGLEACDDSNLTPGDGCPSDCLTVETGWECLIFGIPCTPICGDGLRVGSETCDDGS